MSGKRIGYIRICAKDKSGKKQLQTVALDIIFTDTEQNKNTENTRLEAAIHSTTTGDQVFVDSIDRFGINKMDALRCATEFTSRGASVTFIQEGLVFNQHDEPMSMLIKMLLVEINPHRRASFEEKLCTRVTTTKIKPVTKTPKVTLTPKQVDELKRRASGGENKTALARHFAISRESLIAYLR